MLPRKDTGPAPSAGEWHWMSRGREGVASTRPGALAWPRRLHASGLGLDGADLADAPDVARGAAEPCGEEALRARDGSLDTDHAGPEGQHVHVVVLDALTGGVGVVAQPGANAGHLGGGDRGAHAAAADEDAAVRPTIEDGQGKGAGVVRVVVPGVRAVAAQVDQLVAERG